MPIYYIFLGILAIFIYAMLAGHEFMAGAAFSPILIILGILIEERLT